MGDSLLGDPFGKKRGIPLFSLLLGFFFFLVWLSREGLKVPDVFQPGAYSEDMRS